MDKTLFNLISQSKVVIFDFDNTMASTEKYSWKAYTNILKDNKKEFYKNFIKLFKVPNMRLSLARPKRFELLTFGSVVFHKNCFIKPLIAY